MNSSAFAQSIDQGLSRAIISDLVKVDGSFCDIEQVNDRTIRILSTRHNQKPGRFIDVLLEEDPFKFTPRAGGWRIEKVIDLSTQESNPIRAFLSGEEVTTLSYRTEKSGISVLRVSHVPSTKMMFSSFDFECEGGEGVEDKSKICPHCISTLRNSSF